MGEEIHKSTFKIIMRYISKNLLILFSKYSGFGQMSLTSSGLGVGEREEEKESIRAKKREE